MARPASARKKLAAIGSSLLLLGFALGVVAGDRWEPPGAAPTEAPAGVPRAPEAAVARPAARAAEDPEDFVGVVLVGESVDVAAKFEARIVEVRVNLGDRVQVGDPIATLDAQSIRQELAIADASLHAAQAERAKSSVELSEAAQRLSRSKRLGATSALSQEDLSAAHFQEKRAAASLQAAAAYVAQQGAKVAQLREMLLHAEIRAPVEGIVAARYQAPGAVVPAGTPIVRLISAQEPWVRFAVPKEKSETMQVGQAIRVMIGAPGQALPGKIEHIAPEIDDASQMLVVEAKLDPESTAKAHVQSGQVARVSLKLL